MAEAVMHSHSSPLIEFGLKYTKYLWQGWGFRSDRGGDRRGGFRSDRGASRTRDEGQGGGRSFPSDWSQDVGKPTSRGGRFGSDRPRRPRR